MRLRATIGAIAAVAALTHGVSAASAATQVGNPCVTSTTAGASTFLMTGKGVGNPLPIAVPSDGVITKFQITLPSISGTLPQKLKVARPTSTLNSFTIVGESTTAQFGSGATSANTRIPVKAGDLLGLFATGSPGTLACGTGLTPADTLGQAAGDQVVGATATYSSVVSAALPVVATVEADGDGDGFGDETQDGCPQSATFQGPCPVITLDSVSIGEGSAVKVFVSSSLATDVTVGAKAKLPKAGGKSSKRKAKAIRLGPVTKAVNPPKIGDFTLRFPKALKQALASGKSVKLTVTASATDVIGRVSTSSDKLKLKG
jgi:hypothetical protein